MKMILLILIAAILLFGLALLLLWLPLPPPFPAALSQGRNLMAAVVTGVLGFGYLVGLAFYLFSSFRQASRILDPALASRGLAAQNHMGFGRQYHGFVDGRQVEVIYMPARGLQHALLNVSVSAEINGRMAVGERRPLMDCGDCAQVNVEEAELAGLQIYGEDGPWVRRLLAEPANRILVGRVLSDQKRGGLRELYLQRGRIWLRARPSSWAAEEHILLWLDDLLALADATEGVRLD